MRRISYDRFERVTSVGLTIALLGGMAVVYRILCRINGMSYIGCTIQPLNRRLYQHLHPTSESLISYAIAELGAENFTVQVLDTVDDSTGPDAERAWIHRFGSVWPHGYNRSCRGATRCFPVPTHEKRRDDGERAETQRAKCKPCTQSAGFAPEVQELHLSDVRWR